MDSRIHGNDRSLAHRHVSFPQWRESIISPLEPNLSTANTYAANPPKVKPFIRHVPGGFAFIIHEGSPEMKKARACDSGLFGVRRENLN